MDSIGEWEKYWRQRLASECPQQSYTNRETILHWLGYDLNQLELLTPTELQMIAQRMEYRLSSLRQRYLGVERQQAYRHLITRLANIAIFQYGIKAGVFHRGHGTRRLHLTAHRLSTVIDVLPKVLLDILQNDKYMQQQMAQIAQLTKDEQLRNALLFASLEEYCWRSIRNQPLLAYCFVDYLQRTSCCSGLKSHPAMR